MPTKKPRLTVVLEPKTAAVLDELSVYSGKTKSKWVGEMLLDSTPALMKILNTLKELEKMPMDIRAKAAERVEGIGLELASSLEKAQQQDWVSRD